MNKYESGTCFMNHPSESIGILFNSSIFLFLSFSFQRRANNNSPWRIFQNTASRSFLIPAMCWIHLDVSGNGKAFSHGGPCTNQIKDLIQPNDGSAFLGVRRLRWRKSLPENGTLPRHENEDFRSNSMCKTYERKDQAHPLYSKWQLCCQQTHSLKVGKCLTRTDNWL